MQKSTNEDEDEKYSVNAKLFMWQDKDAKNVSVYTVCFPFFFQTEPQAKEKYVQERAGKQKMLCLLFDVLAVSSLLSYV